MSLKLCHASDFHIGSPLGTLGEKAESRRAELLLAFSRLCRICREETVQVLLLAGDIFDSVVVERDEVDLVRQSLEELTGTRVFVAPGNHDPATVDSPWLTQPWPANVHIFQGPMQSVELPEWNTRVYGAGFLRERQEVSLLEGFRAADGDFLNLCVLHGDLTPHSPYDPVTLGQIAGSGMDYLALGHIHQRTGVLKEGPVHYAFCGCPEGRGFDELGEKGVFLGTMEKGLCNLAFVPLCKRQFVELSADVSDCDTQNQMLTVLEEAVSRVPDWDKHFYKLILTGEADVNGPPRLDLLQSLLAQKLYAVKLRDRTRPRVDLDLLATEVSLKGVFAKRVRTALAEVRQRGDTAGESLLLEALKLGLAAFEGEVAYRGD